MVSSANGQDEPNPALTQADKMQLSCPLGIAAVSRKKMVTCMSYNKSFINQAHLITMAGCWPQSFFILFGVGMDLDWDSVHNTQQRSWPISTHLDLIIHIYMYVSVGFN